MAQMLTLTFALAFALALATALTLTPTPISMSLTPNPRSDPSLDATLAIVWPNSKTVHEGVSIGRHSW
jgi:hypothetical protein